MSRSTRSAWKSVRESLEGYDAKKLAALLRQYLAPRVPPGTRKLTDAQRDEMKRHILHLLKEHLGDWYNDTGYSLGEESFGGYCWCHRFFNQKPVANMSVEDNIQLMLNALEDFRAWLFKLDAHFNTLLQDLPTAPEDADIRVLALADGLAGTVKRTMDATGCEESWYIYLDQAMDWMFQALGSRPGYQAGKLMHKLFAFESWHGPSDEELADSAQKVALAVVEDEGHRPSKKR